MKKLIIFLASLVCVLALPFVCYAEEEVPTSEPTPEVVEPTPTPEVTPGEEEPVVYACQIVIPEFENGEVTAAVMEGNVGDVVEFGGLLGYAPIIAVNKFNSDKFINRGGRIPAPIHSLRN